jgi:DNA-binding transcriptional LysR family regulator
MNIAMLSTLPAILDQGTFAAAAQATGCTPSAVSLQVKQLEAYFGRPLFDRSGRTARPTAFAREAARVARDCAAMLEALRARPSMQVSGLVRLGAIASVQTDALPGTLRALRDRHPALEVRVSLADSDALLAELRAGRIDLAALVRPVPGGSTRLAWRDLARQPYVMLVPAAAEDASPRELLQRHGLIRYDTSLTGGRIAARYVRRIHPAARCTMDVRSIDAIVAMVSAGLGFSVVPRPRDALLAANRVRAVSLGRNAPKRRIAAAWRGSDGDNRNVRAVADALASAYSVRDH